MGANNEFEIRRVSQILSNYFLVKTSDIFSYGCRNKIEIFNKMLTRTSAKRNHILEELKSTN